MAKKQTKGKSTVVAPATIGTKHARIELPEDDFERMRRVAKANGLSVSAYIRQAVLKQVRRDEADGGID